MSRAGATAACGPSSTSPARASAAPSPPTLWRCAASRALCRGVPRGPGRGRAGCAGPRRERGRTAVPAAAHRRALWPAPGRPCCSGDAPARGPRMPTLTPPARQCTRPPSPTARSPAVPVGVPRPSRPWSREVGLPGARRPGRGNFRWRVGRERPSPPGRGGGRGGSGAVPGRTGRPGPGWAVRNPETSRTSSFGLRCLCVPRKDHPWGPGSDRVFATPYARGARPPQTGTGQRRHGVKGGGPFPLTVVKSWSIPATFLVSPVPTRHKGSGATGALAFDKGKSSNEDVKDVPGKSGSRVVLSVLDHCHAVDYPTSDASTLSSVLGGTSTYSSDFSFLPFALDRHWTRLRGFVFVQPRRPLLRRACRTSTPEV